MCFYNAFVAYFYLYSNGYNHYETLPCLPPDTIYCIEAAKKLHIMYFLEEQVGP